MKKAEVVLKHYLNNNCLAENELKYMAAVNIKALLGKLDYNAEVIPENNESMLIRMMTSLKGYPLCIEEKELIKEIINYEKD